MLDQLPGHYHAWVWRQGNDPLKLQLEERSIPVPRSGEVLVRNEAIGLNPVDWKMLGGSFMQAGHIPGVDGAGTIVAIGRGVPESWSRRRVAYHTDLCRDGSFAEYTVVAARALMRVPDKMDVTVAAAFPCPALTAAQALAKLPASADGRLLIAGAGGSVGHYLVQLARKAEWRVTVMCNQRHWERLRSLGAEDCVAGPSDHSVPNITDMMACFHAVIDSVGPDHAASLAPALKANGHLVAIQGRIAAWPCEPFGRALSMHEIALGALHRHGDAEDWQQLTRIGECLLHATAEGRLQADSHVIRPFDDLPQLLDALRHRSFSGKPLIRL